VPGRDSAPPIEQLVGGAGRGGVDEVVEDVDRDIFALRQIGVTVAPGPIALTRIPRPAYSSASVRVRFIIPSLLTE
jgi:hypothetical protein